MLLNKEIYHKFTKPCISAVWNATMTLTQWTISQPLNGFKPAMKGSDETKKDFLMDQRSQSRIVS